MEIFQAVLPHGITLSCRASGIADGPRVMLLHGFPEGAFVWDGIQARLAHRARLVAPNLRGYEHSSAPYDVGAYQTAHLIGDVATLIEQTGAPVDLLVAHDWGGVLAWGLAARRPDLLRHLMIINAPHPAIFLRELRDNPAQQARSAYMNFLCRRDAAELLAEDDFARMWPFFCAPRSAAQIGAASSTDSGDLLWPAWLDEAQRQQFRDLWERGLDGPLNYYRASPLKPPISGTDAVMSLSLAPEQVTVKVPTTVLWGEEDRALPASLLDGLETYVPDLRIVHVPQADHWIVHAEPDRVAAEISLELDRLNGSR